MLFFQLEAHRVVPRIGEVGKAVCHAQYKQHDGIAADGHARLAFFDFDQRRPADGRTRGDDFCGNTPAPARITYVVAELAQRTRYGYWEHS